LIAFPTHALLIVEERLKEQEAEGVQMPEGMPLDDLALRVLVAAEILRPKLPLAWPTRNSRRHLKNNRCPRRPV
jgi:hypothetical protein